MIKIEDWVKVELKVGNVILAEKINNSEKLLKIIVLLKNEKRQVVAGIGEVYKPDDLIGRQIIIVANLEYKIIMGVESQGMIVAAKDNDGKPVLISPVVEAENGCVLK